MAINSKGYLGNFDDVSWAQMMPFHGFGRAAGLNQSSLQVGINPDSSQARSVVVSPGRWVGDGVIDNVFGTTVLNFPPVTVSCYGAVVMNHNWSTQVSNIVAVPGSASSPTLPPLNNTPGTNSDYLLCLVGLDPGSSAIRTLLDRRSWVEGPASFPAYRQTDNPFSGLGEIVTISSAYLRAGEYLLHGVASMSVPVIANNLTTDGSVSILASSFGDPDGDLGGMGVHIPGGGAITPAVQRPFSHKGGPLTARLTANFPGVTAQAYAGSSIIAEFVKSF